MVSGRTNLPGSNVNSDILQWAIMEDRKLSEAWPQFSDPLHDASRHSRECCGCLGVNSKADRVLFIPFVVDIDA